MDNLALSQGGNIAFNSGALANGTNTGTIQTTAAISYIINGQFFSKAATNNVSIAYTGPAVYSANNTASNGSFVGSARSANAGAINGSTRLYGLYLDAAGNISVEPGPIVDNVDLAAGNAGLHFPAMKRGNACFGVVRISLTSGTSFVPGTTALNAAGVTTTYLNLASIPGEPLTS